MQKLYFVLGTRPEAIKLAPVILLAREQPDDFHVKVCATGQHKQMLDQVLSAFDIVPDVDLNLMRPNQTLADISSRTLKAVSDLLEANRSDWVLVQGDTTTVWAAAVAAFFLHIPVAHVEAGLRTNDKRQPFPEEINRRIVSQIADVHFAPTERAKQNLLAEGIDGKRIFVTGNTVVDALYWILEKNEKRPSKDVLAFRHWAKETFAGRQVVLITGHRRESFGKGFENICNAISELAERHKDLCWVYPVHLNPNVQEPVRQLLKGYKNVYLIGPIPYAAFVWLMQRSEFILTDSGGVQEEAPSFGKQVVVMRNKTERPEGIEAGFVTLVGSDKKEIIEGCERVLKISSGGPHEANPYGDGKASRRILDTLKNFMRSEK